MEKELLKLRQENTDLKKKLDEDEKQHEVISARLCSLKRFTSDADINFYTGLPNYATLFNFLNIGEDRENGVEFCPNPVIADKGFQIQDILPLGVNLNIPPFLGSDAQMSAAVVVLLSGF